MNPSVETFEWALSKGVTGVLSVVILALVYVVRSLWEKINKLQKEKDDGLAVLQAQKDALYAARLVDAERNTTALLTVQAKTHELIGELSTVADVVNHDARVETRRTRE